MATSVIVLSVVVLLFAVASAVLGFIAEKSKLTRNDIKYSAGGVCVYPAKPAYVLGICAAALLAAAQIITSVAGACSGCASGPMRKKAIPSAILSWVLAALAVASYAQGVAWNKATTRDGLTIGGLLVECRYLKDAVFTRAALLGLFAAMLGICSYAMLRAPASGDEPKPDGQQPEAGEAQNPPQVQAYMRMRP